MFYFSSLVAANIATIGHDNDLFEERDRRTAHFDHTGVETGWARRWESHEFLLDISFLGLVRIIVNWLSEIHVVRVDLSSFTIIRSSYIALGVSLLLCLIVDGLNLCEESLLLLSCRFRSFSLGRTIGCS